MGKVKLAEQTTHGTARGGRMVKKFMQTTPNFGMHEEYTVCEVFCARCGWRKIRGVRGMLRWLRKHDDHRDLPRAVEAEA